MHLNNWTFSGVSKLSRHLWGRRSSKIIQVVYCTGTSKNKSNEIFVFNYTKKLKIEQMKNNIFFRRHVKKLKDSYLSERVARYLSLLPEVTNASSSSSLLSS